METPAERKVVRLISKGKRSLKTALFSRLGLIVLLMLVQIGLLFGVFRWFAAFVPHLFGSSILFNLIMVIILLNSRTDPSAKLTWLVIIMVTPIFGALLYLYTRSDIGHRALKRRTAQL